MTAPTFEQTYIKYPFAPLVSLALKICAYFVNHNRHNDTHVNMTKGTPHAV